MQRVRAPDNVPVLTSGWLSLIDDVIIIMHDRGTRGRGSGGRETMMYRGRRSRVKDRAILDTASRAHPRPRCQFDALPPQFPLSPVTAYLPPSGALLMRRSRLCVAYSATRDF